MRYSNMKALNMPGDDSRNGKASIKRKSKTEAVRRIGDENSHT
jgi:hypothetical protein